MKHSNSRRDFLKMVMVSGAALLVAPLVKIQNTFADAVKADDVMAKALGYVADAKTSQDRPKDKAGKQATCESCQFYQNPGKPTGKCTLITNGDVAGAGWCRSWSKRPDDKKDSKKKA